MKRCECATIHTHKRIVLTGGPGAGKTAVLDLIRRSACEHVAVLKEAAGIVFGGGFPREPTTGARCAAQRAIFYVQRELEAAADSTNAAVVLCDRGMVDGIAYWPGPDDLWASVGTTRDELLRRYEVVIHLRTPDSTHGYGHQNRLRIESSTEAAAIDTAILDAWDGHPRRYVIEAMSDFDAKATRVLEIVRDEVPECCREHIRQALTSMHSARQSWPGEPVVHASSMEITMRSLTIPITGMSCEGCVNNVRNALSTVPGVTDAQVKIGAATVRYDPALTNPDAIRGVITQAGYGLATA